MSRWKKVECTLKFTINEVDLHRSVPSKYIFIWKRGRSNGQTEICIPNSDNKLLFNADYECPISFFVDTEKDKVRPKKIKFFLKRIITGNNFYENSEYSSILFKSPMSTNQSQIGSNETSSIPFGKVYGKYVLDLSFLFGRKTMTHYIHDMESSRCVAPTFDATFIAYDKEKDYQILNKISDDSSFSLEGETHIDLFEWDASNDEEVENLHFLLTGKRHSKSYKKNRNKTNSKNNNKKTDNTSSKTTATTTTSKTSTSNLNENVLSPNEQKMITNQNQNTEFETEKEKEESSSTSSRDSSEIETESQTTNITQSTSIKKYKQKVNNSNNQNENETDIIVSASEIDLSKLAEEPEPITFEEENNKEEPEVIEAPRKRKKVVVFRESKTDDLIAPKINPVFSSPEKRKRRVTFNLMTKIDEVKVILPNVNHDGNETISLSGNALLDYNNEVGGCVPLNENVRQQVLLGFALRGQSPCPSPATSPGHSPMYSPIGSPHGNGHGFIGRRFDGNVGVSGDVNKNDLIKEQHQKIMEKHSKLMQEQREQMSKLQLGVHQSFKPDFSPTTSAGTSPTVSPKINAALSSMAHQVSDASEEHSSLYANTLKASNSDVKILLEEEQKPSPNSLKEVKSQLSIPTLSPNLPLQLYGGAPIVTSGTLMRRKSLANTDSTQPLVIQVGKSTDNEESGSDIKSTRNKRPSLDFGVIIPPLLSKSRNDSLGSPRMKQITELPQMILPSTDSGSSTPRNNSSVPSARLPASNVESPSNNNTNVGKSLNPSQFPFNKDKEDIIYSSDSGEASDDMSPANEGEEENEKTEVNQQTTSIPEYTPQMIPSEIPPSEQSPPPNPPNLPQGPVVVQMIPSELLPAQPPPPNLLLDPPHDELNLQQRIHQQLQQQQEQQKILQQQEKQRKLSQQMQIEQYQQQQQQRMIQQQDQDRKASLPIQPQHLNNNPLRSSYQPGSPPVPPQYQQQKTTPLINPLHSSLPPPPPKQPLSPQQKHQKYLQQQRMKQQQQTPGAPGFKLGNKMKIGAQTSSATRFVNVNQTNKNSGDDSLKLKLAQASKSQVFNKVSEPVPSISNANVPTKPVRVKSSERTGHRRSSQLRVPVKELPPQIQEQLAGQNIHEVDVEYEYEYEYDEEEIARREEERRLEKHRQEEQKMANNIAYCIHVVVTKQWRTFSNPPKFAEDRNFPGQVFPVFATIIHTKMLTDSVPNDVFTKCVNVFATEFSKIPATRGDLFLTSLCMIILIRTQAKHYQFNRKKCDILLKVFQQAFESTLLILLQRSIEKSERLIEILSSGNFQQIPLLKEFNEIYENNRQTFFYGKCINNFLIHRFTEVIECRILNSIIKKPEKFTFTNAIKWNSFLSAFENDNKISFTILKEAINVMIMIESIAKTPEVYDDVCPHLPITLVQFFITNFKKDKNITNPPKPNVFNKRYKLPKAPKVHDPIPAQKTSLTMDVIQENFFIDNWNDIGIDEANVKMYSFLPNYIKSAANQ
ncbi:hypothetical protein TRFO_12707 [Tritrichomonas foetus]|uniref:C2 NT-type domain-containing protein n=1 Tax=Tritrichomonas foetus TaxID=1144522 RepID=A0A1J4L0H7_9EUKA|nr:hypothetical protein TRFO_12707 [Tritrichomonas foetus]|eukprot:OHT17017.1 hypothetical protein TRFO_12707 [Tritrichomonas foetus]